MIKNCNPNNMLRFTKGSKIYIESSQKDKVCRICRVKIPTGTVHHISRKPEDAGGIVGIGKQFCTMDCINRWELAGYHKEERY